MPPVPPTIPAPSIPAPQTATSAQPWQQPVDNQALALSRAIALQESTSTKGQAPDYNAHGASGEFGAYQWMPGEFQADAKQFGLDPTDTSPANQDKVAYSWVKSKKDAGLQPAQIASTWNSGSPDNWQNHSGVNSKGVAYDTPAYVQGVKSHYEQIYSSMNPQPADGTQVPAAASAPEGILGDTPSSSGTPLTQKDLNIPELSGKPGVDMSQVPGQIASDFKNAYDTIVHPTSADQASPFAVTNAVFTAAASVLTRPLSAILAPTMKALSDKIVSNPSILEGLNAVNNVIDKNPQASKDIGDAFNSFLTGFGLVGGAAELGTAPVSPEYIGPTSMVTDTVPPPGTGIEVPAKPLAPTPEDLQSIKEMITPKPTVAQARLAMRQGRLVPGQEPGLITQGTPDQVLTTDQQLKSTLTIARRIPGASKMSEPDLYSELQSQITKVATDLKPEMEVTPLNPDTVEKINEQNTALRKQLIEDAPATEEANVTKRQDQFEAFLKKSGSDNMNDLWETAKAYDDSIPDRVKNANSNSSDQLQAQRSEWLQRRAIIRGAINDTETGMGATSQKAFSDMTDMYEAQNGLISKAKINTTGAPSQLNQFLKTPIGRAISTGAEIIGAGSIIKGVNLIP